ncbi:MAG: hypothetical protein QOG64_1013 [Acidimicrobiaceae bacterium]|nr:hypothetical protein [Acidimicrobiaceae bacterium]
MRRFLGILLTFALASVCAPITALAGSGNVGDPRGDTSDPRADIQNVGASYGTGDLGEVRLDLHLLTTPPPDDHAWQGDTDYVWLIDTDGNGEADWFVHKTGDGVFLRDRSGAVPCNVRDFSHYDTQADFSTLSVQFNPSCIGGPSVLRYAATSSYDGDGIRGNNSPSTDLAPDAGWADPVSYGTSDNTPPKGRQGYLTATTTGELRSFGNSTCNLDGRPLNRPIVGMAATRDFVGGWLVATDGGVLTCGSAAFFGSTGAIHLNQPIVGMAPTPTGAGYWLVARDGGIFTFGDAQFFGSTGAIHLNQPIVGMAPTLSGAGYWLAASDGGIFAFGAAPFHGSTGDLTLAKPIVGMARTRSGNGYRFVASDGGVFCFGDATFEGAATGSSTPVVGMATA